MPDFQSLDFVINRFFIKLFTTECIKTVKYCQEYFDFSSPSVGRPIMSQARI